jgi:hypothetical protein
MGQKMSLLKSPANGYPVVRVKLVGEIEPERLLYSSSRAGNALKVDLLSLFVLRA